MFATLILTSALLVAINAQPMVTSLIEGRLDQNGATPPVNTFLASVTMVQDGSNYILVDTPTATDTNAKMMMQNAMTQRNVNMNQINHVVVTHGHPDHFGQDGAFPTATHYYNNFKYTGASQFAVMTYDSMGSMQLTPNVQLWQTPGHTPQDISVIVRNVPSRGTVAIVGDLFLNAADPLNSQAWASFAWNAQTGMVNRNKVICAADWIVPGHGAMFQVTSQMKSMASCSTVGTSVNNNMGTTNNQMSGMGQMAMYPGRNEPLQCFSSSNCAGIMSGMYPNCVRSTTRNYNVCCSTMTC